MGAGKEQRLRCTSECPRRLVKKKMETVFLFTFGANDSRVDLASLTFLLLNERFLLHFACSGLFNAFVFLA